MLSILLGALLAVRVPVSIHGLSVTPSGFVALLRCTAPDRILPLTITRSSTVDVTKVQSPEALTLLQLWQAIDMAGPVLPPETLDRLAEAPGTRLLQVRVRATDDCELLVSAGDESIECAASAFEGIGLCLRYGAQIVADVDALEGGRSITGADLMLEFPACFTRADAALQQKRLSDELRNNLVGSGLAPAPARNANAPPRELLDQALGIARDRGDAAAAAKILATIREAYGEEDEAAAQQQGGEGGATVMDRLLQQMRASCEPENEEDE